MLTQKERGISTKNQEPLCCEAVVVLSMCCTFHLTCFALLCLDRAQRTLAVDPDRIPPGSGMKNTTFIYIKMTIWAKHIKVRWTLSLLKWDRRRDRLTTPGSLNCVSEDEPPLSPQLPEPFLCNGRGRRQWRRSGENHWDFFPAMQMLSSEHWCFCMLDWRFSRGWNGSRASALCSLRSCLETIRATSCVSFLCCTFYINSRALHSFKMRNDQ